MNAIDALRRIGAMTIDGIWRLGFITRFLAVLVYSGQSLRRIHLTLRELYFSGVLSLLIILVSGLFVGLVLGCRATTSCSATGRPTPWG
jgi:phospholipid/cholesterol/gamma-HCH transport system permease protein